MFFSKIVLLTGVIAHGVLAMPSDIESRATVAARQQVMVSVVADIIGNCEALQSLADKLPAVCGNVAVAQAVHAAVKETVDCIMPSDGQLIPSAGGFLGGSLDNLGNMSVNGILGSCMIGIPGLLAALPVCGLPDLLGSLAGCSDIIGALGPAGSLFGQLGNLNNILNGLLAGLLGLGGDQVAQLISAITKVINTLKELHDTIEPNCGCADALIAELVLLLNQLVNALLQLLGIGLTNPATMDVVTAVNQLLAASGLNF